MSTKIVFGGEVYGGKSSVRSKGKNNGAARGMH